MKKILVSLVLALSVTFLSYGGYVTYYNSSANFYKEWNGPDINATVTFSMNVDAYCSDIYGYPNMATSIASASGYSFSGPSSISVCSIAYSGQPGGMKHAELNGCTGYVYHFYYELRACARPGYSCSNSVSISW